jgi:hypothetical protein
MNSHFSLFKAMLGAFLLLAGSVAEAGPASIGSMAIVIDPVGCNAASLAQVPGARDLFLGRQLLTAEGQIAGTTDCSGGDQAKGKPGKVYNRWALTLSKFDWASHQLTLMKVILDTSLDPETHLSRALITQGPMRGARIRSAYDPAIVQHRGVDYIAYECILEPGQPGVSGTSSCISVFNRTLQQADLAKTEVIISGQQQSATEFTAAAVPGLLSYRDRLYIYWSALSIDHGQFKGIAIRGAELSILDDRVAVKGARQSRVVHALDPGFTTEMWAPNPADPTADVAADQLGVWEARDSLIASASLGGQGCTAPSDHAPGCFRFSAVKAKAPLTRRAFNQGTSVPAAELPSNAQEYTRPIQDPSGAYWLIGHYLRPSPQGSADSHPMPPREFWQQYKSNSVLVLYPLLDRSLWPKN